MFDYVFIRKKRKTVGIRLDRYGNITVSAPMGYTKSQADRFVAEHAGWIEKKRNELASRNPLPKLFFQTGERAPLFGVEYILNLWEGRKVILRDGSILLPQNQPRDALKKYYTRELKSYLADRLAVYEKKTGVTPARVSVTSARTRWGSCSGKNALSFSFYLAMCVPFAIDYVIVHELCHIRYKNHSKAFWTEVEKYFPDYRAAKKYLRDKSYFTELF